MITVTDQQDIKKDKILEAAHDRFLHYGYSKTTMNEIARDLGIINEQILPDAIWEIVEEVHSSEVTLLVNSIKAEACKGRIKPVSNPQEIVSLLLDALHGVRVSSYPNKKTIFHNKEDLDEIRAKRLLLTDIFIKGLTGCPG
eukprot:gene847-851_t